MRFYLCCIRIELQPQDLLDKLFINIDPVHIRVCKVMSIVVTHSTIYLPGESYSANECDLPSHPVGKISKLLAQSGGSGWLPVCSG